jgi:hypothetical protein
MATTLTQSIGRELGTSHPNGENGAADFPSLGPAKFAPVRWSSKCHTPVPTTLPDALVTPPFERTIHFFELAILTDPNVPCLALFETWELLGTWPKQPVGAPFNRVLCD